MKQAIGRAHAVIAFLSRWLTAGGRATDVRMALAVGRAGSRPVGRRYYVVPFTGRRTATMLFITGF